MKRGLPAVLKATGLGLLICIVISTIWNFTPNASGPFPPEPAVEYVNRAFPSENLYQESYFEHDGVNIHYVEACEGPLVILIHGFPAYWLGMVRQMEALKQNYHVVAIDTLGAGLSDAPNHITDYKLDTRTAHLHALVQHLAPRDTVHLIGYDWGGAYAFAYAQNYSEGVVSITGISGPPHTVFLNLLETNQTQRETSAYVTKLKGANFIILKAFSAPQKISEGAYMPLSTVGKISNEESDLFANNFKNSKRINAYSNWYRANIPDFENITEESYWHAKDAKLDMPVLLIRGKPDLVFVPEYVSKTQEISARSEVLELEDTGHWPHIEADTKTNNAILEFFSSEKITP